VFSCFGCDSQKYAGASYLRLASVSPAIHHPRCVSKDSDHTQYQLYFIRNIPEGTLQLKQETSCLQRDFQQNTFVSHRMSTIKPRNLITPCHHVVMKPEDAFHTDQYKIINKIQQPFFHNYVTACFLLDT
jgi:hypothetical protein